MVLVSRKRQFSNNILSFEELPRLPIPMAIGTITRNASLSFARATLNYQGIRAADVALFESTYGNVAETPEVILFGELFVVSPYGYTRKRSHLKDTTFDSFDITVTLRSPYEARLRGSVRVFDQVPRDARTIDLGLLMRAVRVPYSGPKISITLPNNTASDLSISPGSVITELANREGSIVTYFNGVRIVKLGAGRSFYFEASQIISDGQNNLPAPTVFRRAEVNLSIDPTPEQFFGIEEDVGLVRREPKITTLIQEDRDANGGAEVPPPFSESLKNVSSNSVDGTGPKKVKKTSELINGAIAREKIETYGLAYTAEDISLPDGTLNGVASAYWTKIEEQTLDYLYEPLPGVTRRVDAIPPSGVGSVTLVVDPEYEQAVTVNATGNRLTFRSEAEYPVKTVGNGWIFDRLEPEDDKILQTLDLDPTDEEFKRYTFRKIPKLSVSKNLLRSAAQLYERAEESQPFSVEWVDYTDLDERTKTRVGVQNITEEGQVGIVKPDLDYAETMLVVKSVDAKQAFAFEEGTTNDNGTEEPFVIGGEESLTLIEREVIDENTYQEKEKQFKASNGGFINLFNTHTFFQKQGTIPSVSPRQTQWERKDVDRQNDPILTTSARSKTYYGTTDLTNKNTTIGGTQNATESETVAQAEVQIETRIAVADIQSSSKQRQVKWFHPQIHPGDTVSFGAERFHGTWIVTGSSITLNYSGRGNSLGDSGVTCEGTTLTLGFYRPRSVRITEEDAQEFEGGRPGGRAPTLRNEVFGADLTLGEVELTPQNRRNF